MMVAITLLTFQADGRSREPTFLVRESPRSQDERDRLSCEMRLGVALASPGAAVRIEGIPLHFQWLDLGRVPRSENDRAFEASVSFLSCAVANGRLFAVYDEGVPVPDGVPPSASCLSESGFDRDFRIEVSRVTSAPATGASEGRRSRSRAE